MQCNLSGPGAIKLRWANFWSVLLFHKEYTCTCIVGKWDLDQKWAYLSFMAPGQVRIMAPGRRVYFWSDINFTFALCIAFVNVRLR